MAAPPPKYVSGFPPHIMPGFVRRLNDDATLIQSRCKWCGALIVGSVLQGLPEQESEHRQHCPKAKSGRQ